MTLTITWTPDPILLTNLVKIADQKGQTLEFTLSEAVELYLENQPTEQYIAIFIQMRYGKGA